MYPIVKRMGSQIRSSDLVKIGQCEYVFPHRRIEFSLGADSSASCDSHG